MFERVSKCVPYGMFDSWNHYVWAGFREEPPPWAGTYPASSQSFSRFDLDRFEQLRMSFVDTADSPADVDAWFEKKEAANIAHMEQIQQIEAWIEMDKKSREIERKEMQEKRVEFFEAQAAQMEVPMQPDELDHCPSFRRAVQISKLPTMLSWRLLRDKIQAERGLAEAMAKKDRRAEAHERYRSFLSRNYDATRMRRSSSNSPEQRLVLVLAEKVIRAISADSDQVHESDMINVILRGVYEEYQKVEDSDKPDYGHGPYRLIMDDARHVYHKRIVPLMRRRGTSKMAIAERLKCPVQPCHRATKYFSFEKLMIHLHGPYAHLNGFDFNPPASYPHYSESLWYCLEWPRNLPALPSHQEGSSHWDVDAETSYVRATEKSLALVEEPDDEPRPELFLDDVLAETPFTGSIIYALRALRDNKHYTGRLKSIIALEIARKYQLDSQEDLPTGMQVDEMVRHLDSLGLINQLDDHSCMRCLLPVPCHSERSLKKSQRFFAIACHYLDEHCNARPSVKSEFSLPESSRVNSRLFQEGMDAVEQDINCFRRPDGLNDLLDDWSDDDFLGIF